MSEPLSSNPVAQLTEFKLRLEIERSLYAPLFEPVCRDAVAEIERLRAALTRIGALAPEEPTPDMKHGDVAFRCGEIAREALHPNCSPFGHEGGYACCPEITATVTHEHAWEGSPAQCAICGVWRALAADEAAPPAETKAAPDTSPLAGCGNWKPKHGVGPYCANCGFHESEHRDTHPYTRTIKARGT
jgi:hypothetical protein